MKLGLKIALISIGVIGASVGGFILWRNHVRKTEDDIEIKINEKDIDWNQKSVPYTVTVNGKFEQSGKTTLKAYLVGKGRVNESTNGKNDIFELHLQNGLIIAASSLGNVKTAKVIDFNKKTVKNHPNPKQLVLDFLKTQNIVKNLI